MSSSWKALSDQGGIEMTERWLPNQTLEAPRWRARTGSSHGSPSLPLSFVAVEEWADREALDRHFAQPHLHEFARGLLERVSERPEVAIHEVTDTKPFPR